MIRDVRGMMREMCEFGDRGQGKDEKRRMKSAEQSQSTNVKES